MPDQKIDPAKLTGITLASGGHDSREQGMCMLEVVAWLAGEPHSDHPACVSPVLGEMGRSLNDALPHDLRQLLVPLIPALPGTAGDGHDETRSYMALDWLIRTWLPTWLELSPACRDDAVKVRELDRVVDLASAERAGPVVRAAGKTGVAAWDAAWDATWVAARDAIRDATRVAAWVAAWDATWDATRDATWDATRDAARVATRVHLQPTVEQLQRSAIELYSRMARVGTTEETNTDGR